MPRIKMWRCASRRIPTPKRARPCPLRRDLGPLHAKPVARAVGRMMARTRSVPKMTWVGVAAILTGMLWWRHSRLGRTVALLLLIWTAADLSNASLCALDNDTASTIAVSQSASLNEAPSPPPAPAQPPHVDDCFCCSHCVELQVVARPTVANSTPVQDAPLVLAALRTFGSPLYHPPLA